MLDNALNRPDSIPQNEKYHICTIWLERRILPITLVRLHFSSDKCYECLNSWKMFEVHWYVVNNFMSFTNVVQLHKIFVCVRMVA